MERAHPSVRVFEKSNINTAEHFSALTYYLYLGDRINTMDEAQIFKTEHLDTWLMHCEHFLYGAS